MLFPSLIQASTLKEEVITGVDIMVIRELTGGLYFGEKSREATADGGQKATDVLSYSTYEIERIVRFAYETARKLISLADKLHTKTPPMVELFGLL
jgi:3-isopropylmalate dehydrogenase